jgi:hypothetical protein
VQFQRQLRAPYTPRYVRGGPERVKIRRRRNPEPVRARELAYAIPVLRVKRLPPEIPPKPVFDPDRYSASCNSLHRPLARDESAARSETPHERAANVDEKRRAARDHQPGSADAQRGNSPDQAPLQAGMHVRSFYSAGAAAVAGRGAGCSRMGR